MALTVDLISKFVKATNDTKKTKKDSTVYGTTVEYNGSIYVKIDGSDRLTPISSTADLKPDERVIVMIKNHTAIVTGNMSSPSASTSSVKDVGDQVTDVEILVANKVDTDVFVAEQARVDILVVDNVTIKERLAADEAEIDELQAINLTVSEKLTAAEADIDSLQANKIDVTIADAKYATIEELDATNANLHNLESTYGDFVVLTANKFTAMDAKINDLAVGDFDAVYANIDFSNVGEAAMEYFYSQSGLIKDVVVGDGTITGELVGVTIKGDLIEGNTIVADKLVIKGKDGLFYKLNTDGLSAVEDCNAFSKDRCRPEENITNVEWYDDCSATVTMGSTELVAMYMYLDPSKTYILSYEGENCGVDIFGSDWSTVYTTEDDAVTEQIITGAEHLYFVGIDRISRNTFTFRNVRILDKALYDINRLDGSIIAAKSITASKVNVDDLVAFDATIGGFNITKDSIYSGVKASVDNTTRGVYMNREGEFALGDSNNYLRYYKDSDGKYRLAISADSLEFSANKSIVGGRNLYLGTRYFDGDRWVNMDQWETWDDAEGFGYKECGRYGAWLGLGQYIEAKAGETYTFSFYAKGNENAEITIYNTQAHTETTPGSLYVGPIPDEYIRYHFTFTVNEDCTICPRVENMTDTGWIQIYGLKLEKGSVATDWSPAPEDADKNIKEAAKTASDFMSYDSTNGLQVGNKTTGTWSGFRTQITSTAFNILNSAGAVLASYGAKLIELGKNATDAIIKLCGGKGQIEYVTDEGDSYLQISADKPRIKGTEMASVYSAYTDDSTRWEKSAVNVTPTRVHIYSSECVDPIMQDMLEGWNITDVIVDPDHVYLGTPGDVDIEAEGDINLRGASVNDSYGQFESVVTGSSGIWKYRKYANGDVELDGIYNVSNKACNTALGGWYRTDVFSVGSFPFSVYNAALTANYESAGYGAVLWATSVTSSTQPPSYYLIRPTSATIASGKIIIHVRGRWM